MMDVLHPVPHPIASQSTVPHRTVASLERIRLHAAHVRAMALTWFSYCYAMIMSRVKVKAKSRIVVAVLLKFSKPSRRETHGQDDRNQNDGRHQPDVVTAWSSYKE